MFPFWTGVTPEDYAKFIKKYEDAEQDTTCGLCHEEIDLLNAYLVMGDPFIHKRFHIKCIHQQVESSKFYQE